MRFSQILVTLCLISNLYQLRYIILQLIEITLQLIILFSTDIQEQIKYDKYNLSQNVYECPQHEYTIRIITRRPLIIYIEQFLTKHEIEHLIELANPIFVNSAVVQSDGSPLVDSNYRSSTTAFLARNQTPIVKCIEQRFAQFQGNINPLNIEPLQIVKYEPYQQYKFHYDWFDHPDPLINGGQRITTFFTYLYSNCSHGETEFLHIKLNLSLHSNFCQFIICDEINSNYGIRFRPISGNSIFWFNINEDGYGDYLSYHAGLPPGENGFKIGLNTWTRERIYGI